MHHLLSKLSKLVYSAIQIVAELAKPRMWGSGLPFGDEIHLSLLSSWRSPSDRMKKKM